MNKRRETWSNRELNADTNKYFLELFAGLFMSPLFVAAMCALSKEPAVLEHLNNLSSSERLIYLVAMTGPLLLGDGVRRIRRNNRHWRMYSQDHSN